MFVYLCVCVLFVFQVCASFVVCAKCVRAFRFLFVLVLSCASVHLCFCRHVLVCFVCARERVCLCFVPSASFFVFVPSALTRTLRVYTQMFLGAREQASTFSYEALDRASSSLVLKVEQEEQEPQISALALFTGNALDRSVNNSPFEADVAEPVVSKTTISPEPILMSFANVPSVTSGPLPFTVLAETDFTLANVVLHGHSYPYGKLMLAAIYNDEWTSFTGLTFEQHLQLAFNGVNAKNVPSAAKEAICLRRAAYALMAPNGWIVSFLLDYVTQGTFFDQQGHLCCKQTNVRKMLVKEYGDSAHASRGVFTSPSAWVTHAGHDAMIRARIAKGTFKAEQLAVLRVANATEFAKKKPLVKEVGLSICVRVSNTYMREVRPHVDAATRVVLANHVATVMPTVANELRDMTKANKITLYNTVVPEKERLTDAKVSARTLYAKKKKRAARAAAADSDDDDEPKQTKRAKSSATASTATTHASVFDATQFSEDYTLLATLAPDLSSSPSTSSLALPTAPRAVSKSLPSTATVSSFSALLHETAACESDEPTQRQFDAIAAAPPRFEQLFADDEQDAVTKSMVMPLVLSLVRPAAEKAIPADSFTTTFVPRTPIQAFSETARRKVHEAPAGAPLDWLRRNQPMRFAAVDNKLRVQEQLLKFDVCKRLGDPACAQQFANDVDTVIEQMVYNDGYMPPYCAVNYDTFVFTVQQFGFTPPQIADYFASLNKK